jgi:hypothetical protein
MRFLLNIKWVRGKIINAGDFIAHLKHWGQQQLQKYFFRGRSLQRFVRDTLYKVVPGYNAKLGK